MNTTALSLPERPDKPRSSGITAAIDNGIPAGMLAEALTSGTEYVDLLKFGWGTAVVTTDLEAKLELLERLGIGCYFGGSLLEKHLAQGRFEDFRALCRYYGMRIVEVSNGVLEIDNREKARYIELLAGEFTVISEVGFKDPERSEQFPPSRWIAAIKEDLAAGAWLVTTEARESGHSGVCRANGELRFGLIEELLASGIEADRLLFEAPTTELQAYFVNRVGPNVNLANIPALGLIGLETLRLGLRGDTLLSFELPANVLPLRIGDAASA